MAALASGKAWAEICEGDMREGDVRRGCEAHRMGKMGGGSPI